MFGDGIIGRGAVYVDLEVCMRGDEVSLRHVVDAVRLSAQTLGGMSPVHTIVKSLEHCIAVYHRQ